MEKQILVRIFKAIIFIQIKSIIFEVKFTFSAREQGVSQFFRIVKDGRMEGVVMDIEANEVILTDLSMPHSPRFYRGKLWLLNSGTGEFGYLNLQAGQFEPVAFCPRYMLGLAFWGNNAVVKLTK